MAHVEQQPAPSRHQYPLYILPAPHGWEVLLSPGLRDLTHPQLWALCGAARCARLVGLPRSVLRDLPYSCHRARVVGTTVYWGGDLDAAQRRAVTAALKGIGLTQLRWTIDAHEVRLDHDRELLEQALRQRSTAR